MKYKTCSQNNNKKKRAGRNITYFNPPFSKNVATNIGKKFLQILDKNFPKQDPLHKLFNRNTVKMSYQYTPNHAIKISAHNNKILDEAQNFKRINPISYGLFFPWVF